MTTVIKSVKRFDDDYPHCDIGGSALLWFRERDTRMRVTKAQAQANRRRILQNAAELLRDHGFEGVGIASVMKTSGLTHGGFYNHFPSKDGLLAEAVAFAFAQVLYAPDRHRARYPGSCLSEGLRSSRIFAPSRLES